MWPYPQIYFTYMHLGCLGLDSSWRKRFDQQFNSFLQLLTLLNLVSFLPMLLVCWTWVRTPLLFLPTEKGIASFLWVYFGQKLSPAIIFKVSLYQTRFDLKTILEIFQHADNIYFLLTDFYGVMIFKIHFCYGFGNKGIGREAGKCYQWITLIQYQIHMFKKMK